MTASNCILFFGSEWYWSLKGDKCSADWIFGWANQNVCKGSAFVNRRTHAEFCRSLS